VNGGPHDLDERNGGPTPRRRAASKPYDPAEDREKVRGLIAVDMTVLFAVIMVAFVAAAISGLMPADGLEKLAGLVISPVSGLLGAVAGFYYGEQSRGR
jgi:hypothetical protein